MKPRDRVGVYSEAPALCLDVTYHIGGAGPSLSMIPDISSRSYALSMMVRTLPVAPSSRAKALTTLRPALRDDDEVVGAYRPVEPVYTHAVLLAELVSPVGPLQGIPHVPDPLICPVDETYGGGHGGRSSFLPFSLTGHLYFDYIRYSWR